MQQQYSGQDGYVFLHSPNSWKAVCEQWAAGRVRYAGKLENDGDDPDRIAVFVEPAEDGSESLGDRMTAVELTANPSSSSATAITIGPSGPTHWSRKKQWGAFLRITAKEGNGESIFEWLDPRNAGAPFEMGVSRLAPSPPVIGMHGTTAEAMAYRARWAHLQAGCPASLAGRDPRPECLKRWQAARSCRRIPSGVCAPPRARRAMQGARRR